MTKSLWATISVLLLASTSCDTSSGGASTTVEVAAVQFSGGSAADVDPACAEADVNCAIEALVRRAQHQGADLVVTPEYALEQGGVEPSPKLGDTPAHHKTAPVLARFSALSDELDVYLVISLETGVDGRVHNSQVAFDPDGQVVGVHHKFELYAGENRSHVAGSDVTAFDTPFGRVGLLICADLYGDPRMHDKLTGELGAHIVAVSSMWTVRRATRWPAAFAHDWGVYVVTANASSGEGRGSGVFDPSGRALASSESGRADVTIASIPRGR